MKTKIILSSFLVLAVVLTFSGCGCKKTSVQRYSLQLEIWGLFDDTEAFSEIFEKYRSANPNVRMIKYRKMSPDTYKRDILEALASGQGPDIILIHNSWLPSFRDKISPAPLEIINEKKFRNDFVDVAAQDFLGEGQVYAVPLSVDSLSLYYNKDLFNEAGIANPPATWAEFMEDTKKLTRMDEFGQILVSGAAMGTSYNINRSTDILNLLFLQNGIDLNGQISGEGVDSLKGENVLNFYTQFSNISSGAYSWNPRMHYSIDAFSEGKLAMMLNYSWQADIIKKKSPKLNFAVAPIPQAGEGNKISFANYWGFAVAKTKLAGTSSEDASGVQTVFNNEARIAEAWKFLNYLTAIPAVMETGTSNTSQFDPALFYLEKTQKPAARRDLVERQKEAHVLGVFAYQNLFSKSIIQVDPEAIEGVLAQTIDSVNKGQTNVREALRGLAASLAQINKKK